MHTLFKHLPTRFLHNQIKLRLELSVKVMLLISAGQFLFLFLFFFFRREHDLPDSALNQPYTVQRYGG